MQEANAAPGDLLGLLIYSMSCAVSHAMPCACSIERRECWLHVHTTEDLKKNELVRESKQPQTAHRYIHTAVNY